MAETFSNAISPGTTEQSGMTIVIKNPQLSLTKKTEVAYLTAQNVSMGGQQVIQPSTYRDGAESQQKKDMIPTASFSEVPNDREIKNIRDATVSEIHTGTSGMIKTQFVDDIVKRIHAGQNWITVTGIGGDGKTTVAYMVLDEMMKRGTEVFRVKTVGDYYIITKNTTRCVIMMNDIIGAFAFDNLAFSAWRPVIFDVMETMSRAEESGQPCGVVSVLVQRLNILKEVESRCEKHKSSILGENAVTNLSRLPDKEQIAILDYHLNQKNINDISDKEKGKVIGRSLPYGFPHCCKLFAELKSKGKQHDIVQFFSSPLEILDATTDAYLDNKKLKQLFETLLQKDGRLDTSEIEDDDQRSGILEVSSPLTGSYLSYTQGILTFSHPSVYESVANCIGKHDVVFALKHFSFSFIMEKIRFAESHTHDINVSRGVISVPPTPENIQRLCERFSLSVLYGHFDVLGHPCFQSKDFCQAFFPSITESDSFWNNFNCLCFKQTGKIPIDEQNERGSTMLSKVLQCRNVTAGRVLLELGADAKETGNAGETTFRYLCEKGNIDASVVELMIQHGVDINKTDKDGKTAFHSLCERGKVDANVVALMIQDGVDINKTDKDGKTAFHYLCERGSVDASVLKIIMQHGTTISQTSKDGKTVSHCLCKGGKVDASVVELMIQHGVDINKTDKDGKTAFHYLCERGKVDASVVELMIQHGADVKKTGDGGKTAFHYLCERGNVDARLVKLVIQRGGNVNKADWSGKTALHYLCARGNAGASVVEKMIHYGADVNRVDKNGQTAFHCLCERENAEASVIKLIIQYGADVNKNDKYGRTAFHCLCERSKVDVGVVKLMLLHGTDVNKTDSCGRTAFHCLCERGDVDANVIKLMMQYGADVNKTDWYGTTAFHYLCERGNVDMIVLKLMIQLGADVNKTDNAGKTVFDYLFDVNAVELMIQSGPDVNKT